MCSANENCLWSSGLWRPLTIYCLTKRSLYCLTELYWRLWTVRWVKQIQKTTGEWKTRLGGKKGDGQASKEPKPLPLIFAILNTLCGSSKALMRATRESSQSWSLGYCHATAFVWTSTKNELRAIWSGADVLTFYHAKPAQNTVL